MKANGFTIGRVVKTTALLLFSAIVYSQPDYSFTNPTLISGVDRQVNAQYRYLNVKPGVDARVTIMAITGGLTITSFDNNSGGFQEALQPTIDVPANSSGHAEFKVDFFAAGTGLTVPLVQTEVAITPIDVDGQSYGDGRVNEFDLVYMPNGYYMFDGMGSEMSITRPYGGWWIQGTNTATIDYPGIDTAVKRVMFSVMNATVTSVTFRVGATNTSNGTKNRLRSVYFRKFNYPNPVLPVTDLRSFTGTNESSCINLKWELVDKHSTAQIDLEKSIDGRNFTTEAIYLVDPGTSHFNISDRISGGYVYYRLKLTSTGGYQIHSNILTFKPEILTVNELKIYPTIVESSVTVAIKCERKEDAIMTIIDANGRLYKSQNLALQPGMNNVQLFDLGNMSKGNYFIVLKKKSGTVQSMFFKR